MSCLGSVEVAPVAGLSALSDRVCAGHRESDVWGNMLEVTEIHKVYPPVRGALRIVMRTATDQPVEALRGVSFTVGRGEIVGLVGPNGAGKTTLFRIISTLLEPTGGRVSVDGFDLHEAPGEIRRRIGLLLQGDQGFYGRLTGRENLRFFGVMWGLSTRDAARRSEALMERFGLAGRDRRLFGYSAGMRVRLALARSLLTEPPLLLLDEPTRSLDPAASTDVVRLVRGIAESGRAVLMATHRLNEVTAACDRALLLIDGRCRFNGPPHQIVGDDGSLWSPVEAAGEEP